MRRDEHIANMIHFVWLNLGVNLLPEGETGFVLGIWTLLEMAIEDEVRRVPLMYERAQYVSVN